MISETKLDETYPATKFSLQGFCKSLVFDRNQSDSDIIFYIKGDISSRVTEKKIPK